MFLNQYNQSLFSLASPADSVKQHVLNKQKNTELTFIFNIEIKMKRCCCLSLMFL